MLSHSAGCLGMDSKASVEGGILIYILLAIAGIIIIIIVLQLFTPYKFTNLINIFINSSGSINYKQYG